MHMTKSSIARVCGAAAALFLFGCGSSSISGDPAATFAGNWTFGSGSIQPMCNISGIPPVDLTGDTMTITRVDATHVATTLTRDGRHVQRQLHGHRARWPPPSVDRPAASSSRSEPAAPPCSSISLPGRSTSRATRSPCPWPAPPAPPSSAARRLPTVWRRALLTPAPGGRVFLVGRRPMGGSRLRQDIETRHKPLMRLERHGREKTLVLFIAQIRLLQATAQT